jgi:hypothetical protein
MQVTFLQNLGSDDARAVNQKCKSAIDHKACVIGATVNLPDDAAELLSRKYPGLFEPAGKVKAVAKQPEITAPAK